VPVYADITGWSVSSAGNSRPSSAADGLLLALRRAYKRAETDPAHVQLFEGHAAGTAASDLAELTALTALPSRRAPQPAALGSIKANIGHTRAAAGVAGLLKAVLAMSAGTLPPTTGCRQPHPLLRAAGSNIRVLAAAQPWPDGQRLAGVSTMGFSGTCAHVVLCRSEDHGSGRGRPEPAKAAQTDPWAIEPVAVSVPTPTKLGPAGVVTATGQAAGPGRFVATVRVHRPGVELVADATLGHDSDPYLVDYRVDGRNVLPAVIGLEAMAQAAAMLAGQPLRQASRVELLNPVAVPRAGTTRIRVRARRRGDTVETVLRSAEDDHLRAAFPLIATSQDRDVRVGGEPLDGMSTAIVDGTELYGPLCAQTGRFRRVAYLPELTARSCRGLLRGADDLPWFGRGLAHGPLLLGSPGINDAAIHVLQACVPHRRLIARGCESMTASGLTVGGAVEIRARERSATTDEYVWDVEAVDDDGRQVVTWAGLQLMDAGPLPHTQPWPPTVLAVYLERRAAALGLGPGLRVTVRAGPDGLTLAVDAAGPAAGAWVAAQTRHDEAPVRAPGFGSLPEPLRHQLRERCGEPAATAGARIQAAVECMSRAGLPPGSPLVLDRVHDDGWILLRSRDAAIASTVVAVSGATCRMAVAIMAACAAPGATRPATPQQL
jgi:hypothetical protein